MHVQYIHIHAINTLITCIIMATGPQGCPIHKLTTEILEEVRILSIIHTYSTYMHAYCTYIHTV